MEIRPMLFNTEMVRAMLDGRKTVTRRVVKADFHRVYKIACANGKWNETFCDEIPDEISEWYAKEKAKPPYQPGDVLWVRETWAKNAYGGFFYKADGKCEVFSWRPSIHMPREAARLFLRVKAVRVERLQDAKLSDFLDEGASLLPEAYNDPDNAYLQAQRQFSAIWDSTIKPVGLPFYGWGANPWVWVIEFERCERPDVWPPNSSDPPHHGEAVGN